MPDTLPVAQPTMSAHSRVKSVIYLWWECDVRRLVARLRIAIVSHHPAFLPTSLPLSPLYRMPRFRRRRRSPWKRSSMHIIRPSVCNNNNNNNNNNTLTMFIVLSSWPGHCESSLGSSGECRAAPSGRRPSDQATWPGLRVRLYAAIVYNHHRHLLLLFSPKADTHLPSHVG